MRSPCPTIEPEKGTYYKAIDRRLDNIIDAVEILVSIKRPEVWLYWTFLL